MTIGQWWANLYWLWFGNESETMQTDGSTVSILD